MDLSLERVKTVAKRLDLLNLRCWVVTVAGTNGKGSTVAGLEAIYLAAGYRVGAFTSPFLFNYNEQVRVQGVPADEDVFCSAFEKIARACCEITLTPFEFTTLAAFIIFQKADLDICILEVGLGGRWDAVNVIDADVAIITTIAIDHAAILGDTREKIGYEKAGVFRSGKPAVCGDYNPPESLINYADKLGSSLFCQGQQFNYSEQKNAWMWQSEKTKYKNLPLPQLALQNMSTVLMTVELLQQKLSVSRKAIDKAFETLTLPGRIQVIPGDITHVFDVSHNPAAAKWLADNISKITCKGKTRAVFSQLADKDIVATILIIKQLIDDWFIAPLPVTRGATKNKLVECFEQANVKNVTHYLEIKDAYQAAMDVSKQGDCIVVFGSFHTVSRVFQIREHSKILN
jgi:dihydrofolate synthase/folylpolyglutamate synthase